MKRTQEDNREMWRVRKAINYHSTDEYKSNQAWKEFRQRDGKQVVEVSILELAQKLTAILGGKQE